jgi:hypothetical protein
MVERGNWEVDENGVVGDLEGSKYGGKMGEVCCTV